MQNQKRIRYQRDSQGIPVKCYNCIKYNYPSNHHPHDCKTCYKCGVEGHVAKYCGDDKRPNSSKIGAKKRVYIDRIDQLKENDIVSLDVENVIGSDKKPIPGFVAVYKYLKTKPKNNDGLIYCAKIHQDRDRIYRYATKYSGLRPLDISERALPFKEVQQKLTEILKERKVLGSNLSSDLKALQIENLVKPENRIEFNDIFRDDKDQPIGLKFLAFAILGKRVQEFADVTEHDPLRDARLCVEIYHKLENEKIKPVNGNYQWIREFCAEYLY